MNAPRIDQAIKTYPLEALPDGFVGNTISRIKQRSTAFRQKRSFLDFAIPAFLISFFGGVTLWLLIVFTQGNSNLVRQIETEWLLYQNLLPPIEISITLIVLGAFLLFAYMSMTAYIFYLEKRRLVY